VSADAVLVGLVGETPVLDELGLGPLLARRLRACTWPGAIAVDVEAMNWGALHIVQGLEGRRGAHSRAVLVACTDHGGAPGEIRLGRWTHEEMATLPLQQRIFEAVTGIVSLDNLLVIGEHFKVWPAEVLTVEVQAAESLFGEMASILAEAQSAGSEPDWGARIGFAPVAVLAAIEQAVLRGVTEPNVADGWSARGLSAFAPAQSWHIVSSQSAPALH